MSANFVKRVVLIILVALLYVAIPIYFLNRGAVVSILGNSTSILFKTAFLLTLLEGLFTAFSTLDTILLITTALLVGINISLLLTTSRRLIGSKVKLSVGGGGLLGLTSVGCTSCGFSVLSVLGVGTSLSFLPFGSRSLYIFSIAALLLSIFYMVKALNEEKQCGLKKAKG